MPGTTAFTPADLRAFPLFASFTEGQAEELLRDHRILALSADQRLLFAGDWSDGVFLVCEGIAKVSRISNIGEEVVLALVGPGDLLGELALLMEEGRRTADVVSLTPMKLVKLRTRWFEQALDHVPGFSRTMARMQARRLTSLDQRFSLRGDDAKTRVLATLLELARLGSSCGDPTHPIPDLAQREIAAIAGLARGTTSRILTELRNRGTLEQTPEGLRFASLEPLRRRNLLDA
jgi:CRP/FNR family transcriptional regulator, cyclic AMP receptor protein